MEKITPKAILLQHGKWIEYQKFVKLVCKRREVEARMAKKLISEAYNEKDPSKRILKHKFPDGRATYGMTEFGPPTMTAPTKNNDVMKRHVPTVVSGLKSLVSGDWCSFEEEPKSRIENAGFAIQHLEAYPAILEKLPSLDVLCYFPKTRDSRKKFKALNLYLRIETAKKRLFEDLMKNLAESNLEFPEESVKLLLDEFLSTLPYQKMETIIDEIRAEHYCEWVVEWRHHMLCSANGWTEAETLVCKAKNSLNAFLEEERTRLNKTVRMRKNLESIEVAFDREIDLLIRKLLDETEELKGKCDVCANSSVLEADN